MGPKVFYELSDNIDSQSKSKWTAGSNLLITCKWPIEIRHMTYLSLEFLICTSDTILFPIMLLAFSIIKSIQALCTLLDPTQISGCYSVPDLSVVLYILVS